MVVLMGHSGIVQRPFRDELVFNAAHEALGREVPNGELWCTGLSQSASVLEPGICCLDHVFAILERIAICFGTESTGVSTEML